MTIGELLKFYHKNITGSISIYMHCSCVLEPITIGQMHYKWLRFSVDTFLFHNDVLIIYAHERRGSDGTQET